MYLHVGTVQRISVAYLWLIKGSNIFTVTLFTPVDVPLHVIHAHTYCKCTHRYMHTNDVLATVPCYLSLSPFIIRLTDCKHEELCQLINSEVQHGRNFRNKRKKVHGAVSLIQSTIKGAFPLFHWLLPKPHGLWSESRAND